ncbi:MAG TPA: glycosyltransferase family 4 protein [Streptosporangiaceae bacterium]|jgi:glycosyltransferase involved in cell wall biosynthesis|nr:glycosyltransferase family 4 protein [Streptosporangiaceae bacterium]
MSRLVQVLPHYSPPYVGGMEMRARDRAERLAADGWVVETLTSSGQAYPHTVTAPNLIVRYLRSVEVAHTPIIFALPVALARVPADSVIHLESALAFSPEVAAAVCGLRRLPYVVRVALDSEGHSRARDAALRAYQRLVLKIVYRHAARVIVLTPDDIDLVTIKYKVDPGRVVVIPNATNFALASSPRRRSPGPLRLLFVGRVDLQKNVPLLLRSLRRFIDRDGLPVHLDLAGDGEDMPAVRALIAELSLAEHVSIRGFVTGPELERLYEGADALVLTSTRETFGQVLLEAMTKAVPVVASNIRCVRTIVGDGTTGLLADLDEDSFAAAFRRLAAEPELYDKLSSGALEAARQYSMSATVSAYAATYRAVAARRPPAS